MNIRVILVRTRNPMHIGAVARAMANFGLSDLAVVEPYDAAWKEARSAVGAGKILRHAASVSLAEAVQNCHLVVGTTTGRRRQLFQPVISLPDLQTYLANRLPAGSTRIAVMFGSEKTGLSKAEIEHCHALLRIPTRPETPSMNLAQAVAVVLYELTRPSPAAQANAGKLPFALPTQEQIEDLVERALAVLKSVDYMQHMPVEVQREKLRRAFKHWHMTRADSALLQAIFKRVAESHAGAL